MRNRVSFTALMFCYILMLCTALFFSPKWKQIRTEATISWDVSGYYMYLPAVFIYKDIRQCKFKDSILQKYCPTTEFQQGYLHEKSGNIVMKYTCGQAITMLPFFAIAHSYCKLNPTYPADGFSYPYQLCIGLGMLLYALFGLFLLRKILLLYFKDTTVAVLLFCLVAGSNYLNYAAIDQAMTHNVLFTLYCVLILFTIQFHKKPTYLYAACIGLLVGFMTLIRPTEIIACIIPLAWNISSLQELKSKFTFGKKNFPRYALMGLCAIAIISIQLFYWKYTTHEWIVYSYQDQGFTWIKPHVFRYSFSFQSGWLRYCPMMFLPLFGILFYFKKGFHKLAILSFIIINMYIVMAWDIWDYGGSSGRAMVQSYPLLAFPFCTLIETSLIKKWSTILISIAILLFTYLNIWWVYHSHAGNTHTIGLNKAYYMKVIGRWKESDYDKKLLDNPHSFYGTPKNLVVLYHNDFSSDSSPNAISIDSNRIIRINKEMQFSIEYLITHSNHIKKWIRVSADIHCFQKEWNTWKQALFLLKFFEGKKIIQTNQIKIHRHYIDGEAKNLFIDAIAPNKWDTLKIFFWNADGDKELHIDNLKAITFDE